MRAKRVDLRVVSSHLSSTGGFLTRQLLPRRHTALLVAMVAMFATRPVIGDLRFGPIVFSIALIVLMMVSIYTIQVDELIGEREALVARKRRQSKIGWLLAIPAVADRLVVAFVPIPSVVRAGLFFWLIFFVYITWNELRGIVRQKEVTGETISMSVSVYLLMALTWAFLYHLLYSVQPQAFSFGSSPAPNSLSQTFPVFLYFSLTTISTIGFGDITPLTLQARYAAVAEGITGQFYLAILVARLVALHMVKPSSRDT